MSLVDGDVDLSALARGSEEVDAPRRSWLRIVVPLLILGAFAYVLRDALADLWRERPSVTVVRPVRLEGLATSGGSDAAPAATGAPRQLAVQAAGWVEPDPFPTLVPALAGGVLVDVLVEESDAVEAGQIVATLVSEDATLAYAEVAARVEVHRANIALAQVRAGIAAERFTEAIEVTEAAAKAAARLAGQRAHAKLREASVAEGEALVELAKSEVIVQEELDQAGASGARQVEIAKANLEVAKAKLSTLKADLELAQSAVVEANAAGERAQADVRLRFGDRLARDETQAELAHHQAELKLTEAQLSTASLRVERQSIRAPVDGVVLERLAVAGQSLSAGHAVCSLFQPNELRVRVDVPQGDVAQVRVGQEAEILADARPGQPYQGKVLRIVERADIQKVTLEAQVRVLDADGLLRPDMLTQVRFFTDGGTAPVQAGAENAGVSRAVAVRIAVPARVIQDGVVWVLDPVAGEARRVDVELGGQVNVPSDPGADWREVLGGINLTDKVIDGGRAGLRALSQQRDNADRIPVRLEEMEP